MTDIAPELLEKVQKSFAEQTAELTKEIKSGVRSYEEAYDYATRVGEALSKSFGVNITPEILPDGRMYYNIADKVVRPMLEAEHNLISEAAAGAQQAANKAAGVGIKPLVAEFDEDRAQGIINRVSSQPFEEIKWILNEPVKTFARNTVDQTLEKNVNFQGKSGLHPKIIRTASASACQWCLDLAGTYKYPDVPKEVYARHANCNCVVEYVDGGKYQDVHSKVKYASKAERDAAIQERIRNAEEAKAERMKPRSSITPQDRIKSLKEKYFKNVRFKSPMSSSDIEWLESVGGLGTSADITSEDRAYIRNNIHTVSNKENIGKVVRLSSMDYVYAIELNDFLDYNILWKIPNDDNLNDALAQIKGRRK